MSRMVGTWEWQFDKSMVTLRSTELGWRAVLTYERVADNAVSFTNEAVNPEGSEFIAEGTQVFDGQPYEADRTNGDYAQTISRTPIDEFTIRAEDTRDGMLWSENTQVFSRDGQRMTIVFRDGEGSITAVYVYDKVRRRGAVDLVLNWFEELQGLVPHRSLTRPDPMPPEPRPYPLIPMPRSTDTSLWEAALVPIP